MTNALPASRFFGPDLAASGEFPRRVASSARQPYVLRQHALNVAKWFPEVLLSLGAPDLEEQFVLGATGAPRLTAGPTGCALEVDLRPRPSVAKVFSAAEVLPKDPQPARSQDLLWSLEQHAGDLEFLAAYQSQELPACRQAAPSATPSLLDRIGAATEELERLSQQLQLVACSAPGGRACSMGSAPAFPAAPAPVREIAQQLQIAPDPVAQHLQVHGEMLLAEEASRKAGELDARTAYKEPVVPAASKLQGSPPLGTERHSLSPRTEHFSIASSRTSSKTASGASSVGYCGLNPQDVTNFGFSTPPSKMAHAGQRDEAMVKVQAKLKKLFARSQASASGRSSLL
eukprot:TRINITY_DN93103_c0_g1_i1.p1 TRINITY_DN93103_c0_g1~~TRINITY_DN93103_c0_g1_i1.p1  ORF type:complete len:364 (-),score=63.73 TRINITY_DN93103_c0_g1_i1:298-1332(-)